MKIRTYERSVIVDHRIPISFALLKDYYGGLPVTIGAGESATLVTSSDRLRTIIPNNGLITTIDYDTEKCSLTKRVNGAPTELFDEDITYSAGAVLMVVKEGTLVTVFYNNLKVGEETVSDGSIVNNTICYELGDSTGIATLIPLRFEGQVLANAEFADTTLGSQLVTGTDSDMSGANNWLEFGLATFNINTVPPSSIANRMYMLGNGGDDYAYLPTILSAGKFYALSLKARLNAGASTTIRVGNGFLNTDNFFEITPTNTEQTFTGTFIAANNTLVVGLLAAQGGFNGIAFEIGDVTVQEITLDDWSTVGTPDADTYLVYANSTLRIVSESANMGVAQTISNTTLYKYDLDINTVVEGELQINGTTALVTGITADKTGYIISNGTTLSLLRAA